VRSMSNVGNNRQGVQITAGLSTGWGYFSGSTSGGSAGNGRTYSIAAGSNVVTVADYYGVDFNFNTSKRETGISTQNHPSTTYDSASLNTHIGWLYGQLRYLRSELRNYIDYKANQAEQNAKNYATSRGYATTSWVSGNYVSDNTFTGWRNNNYNKHHHNVTIDGRVIQTSNASEY